jgi:hypothetical protein
MQDEEITIEPLNCAFCFKDLGFLTIPERESHYEEHFLNDTINNYEARSKSYNTLRNVELAHFPCVVDTQDTVASASSSKTTYTNTLSPKESKSPNRMWNFPKEQDVFWYPEQTTAPPSNYTPGVSFNEN